MSDDYSLSLSLGWGRKQHQSVVCDDGLRGGCQGRSSRVWYVAGQDVRRNGDAGRGEDDVGKGEREKKKTE